MYKYAGLFYSGVAVVADSDGKYIFIDYFGNKINETLWDNYGSYLNGKLIPVKKDGKWGFINFKGEEAVKNIYEDISGSSEGLTGVKKNGKWGYVDENGNLAVNTEWDMIDRFNNNIAVVSKDNKFTLIDNKGIYPFMGKELKTMEKLGLIKGDGSGVDYDYAGKNSTRLQSAIMILRMNGLENEALNYETDINFNEAKNYGWKQGTNIMGYLKNNPDIGFIGDGRNNIKPDDKLTQKQYIKVMLENLGYKQDIDFIYSNVYKFAKTLGLEIGESNTFTNNDMAKITMMFLNAKTLTGEKLIDRLIKIGTVDESAARDTGFWEKQD